MTWIHILVAKNCSVHGFSKYEKESTVSYFRAAFLTFNFNIYLNKGTCQKLIRRVGSKNIKTEGGVYIFMNENLP